MVKVLITGANGFVGSNLVEKFVEDAGFKVKCLVHKNISWLKQYDVELCRGDVAKPETLSEAVKDVDYVFHSAGCLRAIEPETYYEVNQQGTKNIVEAVFKNNPKIKRFVYISTQAAMGPGESIEPKSENSVPNPVSDYGRSKLLGEQEILKYKDRLPVTILRPAAIYGPRDKDLYSFFKLANFGFFPILTGNNSSYIQLLFVKDLVEICYLLTKKDELKNNIYFVSESKVYTWEDVGNIIGSVFDKKIKFIRLPLCITNFIAYASEKIMKLKNKPAVLNRDKVNEFSQKYWVGDTTTLTDELKYDFTPLSAGAKITYQWYKQNHWL